jgi:septum formation protein
MQEFTPQGPFRPDKNLVLGSASPRRQTLLASLGLHFEVLPSAIEEPPVPAHSRGADYVLEAARSKTFSVARMRPDSVIIGADTAIVLDGSILGKPLNASDALRTLKRLSGRSHTVVTGCCILEPAAGVERSFSVHTVVTMAGFEEKWLQAYVDTGEPLDKAGSYAIQGAGAFLVRSIRGSYTNVVGLPLQEVAAELLDIGALAKVSARIVNGGDHEPA